MKPVVLTVDVGNSHTVMGLFRGEEIVEVWRLTTRVQATSDEVYLRINGLVCNSSVLASEITHIGLSSVVPTLERPWVKALEKLFKMDVSVVSADNCLGLGIDYANAHQLGADRICNAIALCQMGLQNGVVVDMGTATTFDVMRNGRFVGGLIIPGINASLEVLTDKTARLLPVTLHWPNKLVADNTDDAIRAGLLFGFLGKLESFAAGIRKELGLSAAELPFYATGGWSSLLMDKTKCFAGFDPHLTLKGIRAVALG